MKISKEKIVEQWNNEDGVWVVHATREQLESLVDADRLPFAAITEWEDWQDYMQDVTESLEADYK
jgi:hypothetical protein|tara:strand:+ start:254 stop:448 length:195 start_codon:yes stop_codon:yes gene_type:complete